MNYVQFKRKYNNFMCTTYIIIASGNVILGRFRKEDERNNKYNWQAHKYFWHIEIAKVGASNKTK